jgi:hypothetical protein
MYINRRKVSLNEDSKERNPAREIFVAEEVCVLEFWLYQFMCMAVDNLFPHQDGGICIT